MIPPIELTTADGYDLQFGTNVVGALPSTTRFWHRVTDGSGPFYFTQLLMPALVAGSKTSPDHHARIVITSSSAAYLDTLHWDTFKDGPARRKQQPKNLYAQSKLVSIGFLTPATCVLIVSLRMCTGKRNRSKGARQALRRSGRYLPFREPRYAHVTYSVVGGISLTVRTGSRREHPL